MKYFREVILVVSGIVLISSYPAQVYPVRFEESHGARRVRGDIKIEQLLQETLYTLDEDTQNRIERVLSYFSLEEDLSYLAANLRIVIPKQDVQAFRTSEGILWYRVFCGLPVSFVSTYFIICDKNDEPSIVAACERGAYYVEIPSEAARIVIDCFKKSGFVLGEVEESDLFVPYLYADEAKTQLAEFLGKFPLLSIFLTRKGKGFDDTIWLIANTSVPIYTDQTSYAYEFECGEGNTSFMSSDRVMWRDIKTQGVDILLFSRYLVYFNWIHASSMEALDYEEILKEVHPGWKELPIMQIPAPEMNESGGRESINKLLSLEVRYYAFCWEVFVSKYTGIPSSLPSGIQDSIVLKVADIEFFVERGLLTESELPKNLGYGDLEWDVPLPDDYFERIKNRNESN